MPPPTCRNDLAISRAAPTSAKPSWFSTCNRTEAYVVAEKFHAAFGELRDFFCTLSGAAPAELSDHLYVLYDDDAARHLFRVASGLESAVLGEHEILGQVRTAWDTARAEGTAGTVLNQLFSSRH